jgi:hypothetical protein
MISKSVATVVGAMLLAYPCAALAEVSLSDMLVGRWRRDDVRLTFEKNSANELTLRDRKRGREQDRHWKQLKVVPNQPIKFSYVPKADELPNETSDGKEITAQIKRDVLKIKDFRWEVEFDKVSEFGKCNTLVQVTFYPGSIEFDLDAANKFVPGSLKAKSRENPLVLTYQRLNPMVYVVQGTGRANRCEPHFAEVTQRCSATMRWHIFQGSDYDSAAGRQKAATRISETKEFFKDYCIDLEVEEFTIAPDKAKGLKDRFDKWYDAVLNNEMGGKKERFSKNSVTKERINQFGGIIGEAQSYLEKPETPLILFMNEYIGGSDGRDTLVSSTQESIQQVGINAVDMDSPHILTHELIHLLGKTGPAAKGANWEHNSVCENAVSRVTRTDSRVTVDFSRRYLDLAEYNAIINSKATLVCKTME